MDDLPATEVTIVRMDWPEAYAWKPFVPDGGLYKFGLSRDAIFKNGELAVMVSFCKETFGDGGWPTGRWKVKEKYGAPTVLFKSEGDALVFKARFSTG